MYTCTVIVTNISDGPLVFLRTCIQQIKLNTHPEVTCKVIIAEQSKPEVYNKVCEIYKGDPMVKVLKCEKVDCGWAYDQALKHVDTEYTCTLDDDAFPISNKWLYMPIKLIEKYGLSFVGTDTGLSMAYYEHTDKFYGKPWKHINNYYRVSPTKYMKLLSEDVGWVRVCSRFKIPQVKFKPTPWGITRGCDNGVIAQWYSEYIGLPPKQALPGVSILGHTGWGVYGINVENLVFHWVFGYNEGHAHDVLGEQYMKYRNEIMSKEVLDQEYINMLLKNSEYVPKAHRSVIYPPEMLKFVDEILEEETKKKG